MLFVLVVGLVGCAQAHTETIGGRPDAGGITVHDSNTGGGDDSMIIDAPMGHPDGSASGGTATLSQTTANNDTQVGLACGNGTYTSRNSFYRVFPLSSYGITGEFHVTGVDFLVSGGANSAQLTISIGTFNGTAGGQTLNAAGITLLPGAVTYTVPTVSINDPAVPAHVAITGDVSGQLVVEIDQKTAGSTGTPYQFYPGANEAGESAPGYISSPDCTDANNNPLTTPTSMDTLAQGTTMPTHSNLVLTATGTY
jgi:hypothetical protein